MHNDVQGSSVLRKFYSRISSKYILIITSHDTSTLFNSLFPIMQNLPLLVVILQYIIALPRDPHESLNPFSSTQLLVPDLNHLQQNGNRDCLISLNRAYALTMMMTSKTHLRILVRRLMPLVCRAVNKPRMQISNLEGRNR